MNYLMSNNMIVKTKNSICVYLAYYLEYFCEYKVLN